MNVSVRTVGFLEPYRSECGFLFRMGVCSLTKFYLKAGRGHEAQDAHLAHTPSSASSRVSILCEIAHLILLTTSFRPAKGVLVRIGNFWYPGRMLQQEQHSNPRKWRIRMWRGSMYEDSNQAPEDLDVFVDESRIVDELWHDRPARREIRVSSSTSHFYNSLTHRNTSS